MSPILCLVLLVFFLLNLAVPSRAFVEEDLRAYQHGIELIKRTNGTYWLLWSSAGNPPKAGTRNWTHDVYYSLIDPSNPSIRPVAIISNPEAQEPASAAISMDGRIMITCEDGWNVKNGVGQRWGLYDENLHPVKPYPQLIRDGGHSGHVAAVGNTFVVFWCDGWDDTVPGADGIGVGKHVVLDSLSSSGAHLQTVGVQISDQTRDWWPIVAGSADHALLLWQRYVKDEDYCDVMYAVYDPAKNEFIKNATKLSSKVKYYTYDVQYYPAIDRFLVIGSYYDRGGFAYLIDNRGRVCAHNTALPPIIRESKPAKSDRGDHSLAVYPRYPDGAFVLALTASAIKLNQSISDDYKWQRMGTAGIFTDALSVYFASLSTAGVVERKFSIDRNKLGAATRR